MRKTAMVTDGGPHSTGRRSLRAARSTVIIAVAVTLAATTTACSSDQSPSTSPAPPAPKVVQLRATGTTGLVRTLSDGAGLAADGFGRLRPTENGPGQLVAATVWPANKTAPARWSADDGRSWQPVAMPADAVLHPSRTRFLMVDDLAMVVSGADPGGLGRLPTIWTTTDAATTFRTSTMTGYRVDDPDAVIEIDGAVPERIEGEYVVFAHIGVEPIRLASSDGRRWTVTPVEVDGTEGIFVFDAVVAFGDRLVASDHHGAFGSEDGGRTWAPLELPGHRFEPGTSAGAARVVGRTAYFSTAEQLWTSDDGRTWHTVRDVPVERATNEPAPRTGIGVLLADEDRLAARIGTEIGDTSYRADLGWSDDGGATWTPADGIPNCPMIEHEVTGWVTDPVDLGDGSAVVTWACNGEQRVLRTTDLGRTWTTIPGSVTKGAWSAPIATDDGAVVFVGAAGVDQPSAPYLRVEPGA